MVKRSDGRWSILRAVVRDESERNVDDKEVSVGAPFSVMMCAHGAQQLAVSERNKTRDFKRTDQAVFVYISK
eukprot:CAMPEP_0182441598 /NCGR_PEP_ID=MMETSP1172-20130603/575_1 /TAXON_ID=708627 /ORGANISM="Timspurckia oligopyrenoides, Strain CCMP3278" /LENGTH=71 /DNA_ID=CAMNT_0024635981 /DNA_START=292 /DNA_END=504 /DNA_ORIENTATION=+